MPTRYSKNPPEGYRIVALTVDDPMHRLLGHEWKVETPEGRTIHTKKRAGALRAAWQDHHGIDPDE
jgi:hypothetical protein